VPRSFLWRTTRPSAELVPGLLLAVWFLTIAAALWLAARTSVLHGNGGGDIHYGSEHSVAPNVETRKTSSAPIGSSTSVGDDVPVAEFRVGGLTLSLRRDSLTALTLGLVGGMLMLSDRPTLHLLLLLRRLNSYEHEHSP